MGSEARVRRGKFVEGSELLGIILSDLIKLVRHLIVEDILAIAAYIVHLRVNIHRLAKAYLAFSCILVRIVERLQLVELVGKLLAMSLLKLLVRDLLEAQAVVPLIEDSFHQVLFKRLRRVFLPEILHGVNRALW